MRALVHLACLALYAVFVLVCCTVGNAVAEHQAYELAHPVWAR